MSLDSAFLESLRRALGSDFVDTGERTLARASHDETHGLSKSLPDAVVFPKSHDDVVKMAKLCSDNDVAMTPRGAGTGKSGGCVPVCGGVVVDFSRMNKIVSLNAADFTVVVEPGVILADLQKHVENAGLFYPPDPNSLEWCTIGGNVAENAGGPSAVKYGVTRDYVLAMRLVCADGRSLEIGKNTIKGVTGLDLVSLMCGSEGTLAFVTQVTLRLLPKPQAVQTALLYFSSREHALGAVVSMRHASSDIRCIEFLDALSLSVLVKLGFQRPVNAQSVLLVEVDGGSEEQLLHSLAFIDESLHGDGYLGAVIAKDARERAEFWTWRRRLSEATKKSAKFKVSEDIVVPLSNMNAFLNDIESLSKRYAVRMCAFGHAGDGNLHVQVLFDEDRIHAQIPEILEHIFKKTLAHGGTLTGEHGIGIAKQPYLSLEQGPELIDLQRQIKAVFDPRGLLNPGKLYDKNWLSSRI